MLMLGVIGGMGPEATQLMFKRIIDATAAKCDQDHLDTLIFSHASIPDRTSALKCGDTADLVQILKNDARMLEHCGASVLAIPCNTAHAFISDIRKCVSATIINMIEETVLYIKSFCHGVKKVGILATDGTVKHGLYRQALECSGLEPYEPDEAIQKIVMKIIYDQIKAGEKGNKEDFLTVDEHLKKNGCDGAILACTELSVFRTNHDLDGFYIDALQVLAERCVELCGGNLKKAELTLK